MNDSDLSTQTPSVARRDSFELLKAPYKDRYGRWIVEGIVARPGIYEYQNPDGSIRSELVTAEALSKNDFLQKLSGVPVTIEHPSEDVTPENSDKYRVGTCLEAKMVEGCSVWVRLVIDTERGIQFLINERVSGLSPHYYAQTEDIAGDSAMYGPHSSVQVLREDSNHIALTRNPRGGYKTSVRIDSLTLIGVNDQMDLLKSMLVELGLDEAKIAEFLEKFEGEMKAKMAGGEGAPPAADVPAEDAPDVPAEDMSEKMDMEPRLVALEERLGALEAMMANKDADEEAVADAEDEEKDEAVKDSKSVSEKPTKAAEATTDSKAFDINLSAFLNLSPLNRG